MRASIALAAVVFGVAGCQSESAVTYTLYRTSIFAPGTRIHWATFDADESDRSYNRNNCEMAARLLNANYRASAHASGKEPDPAMGFWCEAGRYSESGSPPSHFDAAYPTDV